MGPVASGYPRRVGLDRPTEPDTAVLIEAAEALGTVGVLRWEVEERIERPRSTLFRIRASRPAGPPIEAYYKVSRPPPYEGERLERWVATVRSGLARSMELETRLASLVEGEGITFSRALAVDPGSMTVVTLAVRGDPFGKVWRHLVPGARRGAAIESLRLVGRAARLIEECSVDPIPIDERSQRAAIDRRLRRVRDVLPGPTLQGIERVMDDLTEDMSKSDRAMVYCHGDLSGSNVLVDGWRLGIIDFTWPLRQRGFDLAHFAFRIEYDSAVPAALTSPLGEALLSGYGEPAVTEQPGYKFVRLSKLLKVVEETGPMLMTRRGRARAEIESYL
jgi:hypothetical protein